MAACQNPFSTRVIAPSEPFCNREKEQEELARHGRNRTTVVLYSARRYGKTSLMRRVQQKLAGEGVTTIHADFFGVTSIEDVAARLAKAVLQETHKQQSLFTRAAKAFSSFRPSIRVEPDPEKGLTATPVLVKPTKTGLDLLEETLASLGEFVKGGRDLVHVFIDEFQEIVTLPDVLTIEGALRSHVQEAAEAYCFVGSRRRVLLGIFTDRQRPFFQSATLYPLAPLPRDELASFVQERFATGGKSCTPEAAQYIVDRVESYPYYVQKAAYLAYEGPSESVTVTVPDAEAACAAVAVEEGPLFEGLLTGFPPGQIAILRALAANPTSQPYSRSFMGAHGFTAGGLQKGLQRLLELDLVEERDGVWRIVDPVMAAWLRRL